VRKLTIGLSIVALLASTLPVFAQQHHRHGYRPQQRHYVAPRPVPRHYNHRKYAPWVAGAIGLGVLGSMYYYNNRQCWDEMIGYDLYGREVFERYCR
jgi:hypothetical protein